MRGLGAAGGCSAVTWSASTPIGASTSAIGWPPGELSKGAIMAKQQQAVVDPWADEPTVSASVIECFGCEGAGRSGVDTCEECQGAGVYLVPLEHFVEEVQS